MTTSEWCLVYDMHYIELKTVDSGYKLAYNELKIDGFSLEKNKTGNLIVDILESERIKTRSKGIIFYRSSVKYMVLLI